MLKSKYAEIYVLVVLAQFGRFLSHFAIAISLLQLAGSSAVAYGIVAQSLPAILTATLITRVVPAQRTLAVLIGAHVVNGALLAWLALNLSVANIFVFFVLASMLGAYIRPVTQSRISSWVGGSDVQAVRIRINALMAACATLAPVCGGLISELVGLRPLLVMDACIYGVAIFLYLDIERRHGSRGARSDAAAKPIEPAVLPAPVSLWTGSVRGPVLLWFSLLMVGAVLNALEFAVFERAGMAPIETGIALAGWGAGAGLAFALSGRKLGQGQIPLLCAVTFFSSTLFSFAAEWRWLAIALLAAGLANALLTGLLQTAIQFAVPRAADDRVVWAKLHRGMALINLSFALTLGWLLSSAWDKRLVFAALPLVAALLLASSVWVYPGVLGRNELAKQGVPTSEGEAL